MGKLYFERTNGELKFVAEVEEKHCIRCIKDYVKKINPSFEINYVRCWETAEGVKYDVGSYTEFFLYVKE